jgi:acetylornithine deacetylase/succinyl-diaminopimelate desuccinylase-like protein
MKMKLNKHSILYTTLARGLSMKRPHNTPSVDYFTQWLWQEMPLDVRHKAFLDDCDNLHLDMRNDDSNRTLFTAHVDTVHRETGPNKIRKTDTHWYADGACLGADDGAGCAMLMHLIHNKVPAYYIFTQGEECGGIGAKHVADKHGDLLKQFDRAIAFDRRGIDSVITHQGWGRTASDAFAQALADALNADDKLMYLPDDTGVYTDTAEFIDHIGECTNISVGYASEHTQNESLNIVHFVALSEAVLNVQWDKLPTCRKAGEVEDKYSTGKGNWLSSSFGSDWQAWSDDDWALGALLDALDDAEFGQPDELLMQVGESVYPEDPYMAVKFLSKRKITAKKIKQWRKMVDTYDSATVLATIFDQLHVPQ